MDFIQKLKAQVEFHGKVYEKDSRTHLSLTVDGSIDLPGNLDKLVAGGVNAALPATALEPAAQVAEVVKDVVQPVQDVAQTIADEANQVIDAVKGVFRG